MKNSWDKEEVDNQQQKKDSDQGDNQQQKKDSWDDDEGGNQYQ